MLFDLTVRLGLGEEETEVDAGYHSSAVAPPPPPPRVGPEKSDVQISLLLPWVTDRKFTPELFGLLGLITPLRGGGGEWEDVALDREKLLIRLERPPQGNLIIT